MKKKLYGDVKFEDLFDSKRQAVVCYLSLEKRYQEMLSYYKKLVNDLEAP